MFQSLSFGSDKIRSEEKRREEKRREEKNQTIYCWVEWILENVFFIAIELELQKQMQQIV